MSARASKNSDIQYQTAPEFCMWQNSAIFPSISFTLICWYKSSISVRCCCCCFQCALNSFSLFNSLACSRKSASCQCTSNSTSNDTIDINTCSMIFYKSVPIRRYSAQVQYIKNERYINILLLYRLTYEWGMRNGDGHWTMANKQAGEHSPV